MHRIRHSADFERAVRRGVRGGRQTMVVHLVVEPAAPVPAMVGFVVSKAVGNAVTRNKVKRRLREIVREQLPDLAPGSAVVVRALPPAATADMETLRTDVVAGLVTARRRWEQRMVEATVRARS